MSRTIEGRLQQTTFRQQNTRLFFSCSRRNSQISGPSISTFNQDTSSETLSRAIAMINSNSPSLFHSPSRLFRMSVALQHIPRLSTHLLQFINSIMFQLQPPLPTFKECLRFKSSEIRSKFEKLAFSHFFPLSTHFNLPHLTLRYSNKS